MSSDESDSSFTVISEHEGGEYEEAFRSSQYQIGPQKQRASRACQSCKLGHVSCDNERPCRRCIKAGREDECTDSTHEPRKKRQKLGKLQASKRIESFGSSPIDEGDSIISVSPLLGAMDNNVMTNERFSEKDPSAVMFRGSTSVINQMNLYKDGRDLLERVHHFIIERGWMTERESRQHLEMISNFEARKSNRELLWTDEQRTNFRWGTDQQLQQLKHNIMGNEVPTILRDESSRIIAANDSFKRLTGIPENVFNDVMESISMFHCSPQSMRVIMMGHVSMMPGTLVIPFKVRLWTNHGNYLVENLFGKTYLNGTAWMTRYTDYDGYTTFTTISFMPSPETIKE